MLGVLWTLHIMTVTGVWTNNIAQWSGVLYLNDALSQRFSNFTYISQTICDSKYRQVPVVGRQDFELWGGKVNISQNIVPKSILRFHILQNLQYLILKLLE